MKFLVPYFCYTLKFEIDANKMDQILAPIFLQKKTIKIPFKNSLLLNRKWVFKGFLKTKF